MAKKVDNNKIIEAYIKKYPSKEAIIKANLAGLIQYSENRQERNRDFIDKWQVIKKQTSEYFKNLSSDDVGSKEYKNVVDVYMSMLNHTRPSDEDAIILQLMASLERIEKEGSQE